jgi:hypothetical protein
MNVLTPVVQETRVPGTPDYIFWCPGCECGHGIWVTRPAGYTGPVWEWNNSLDRPTFSPSILTRGTQTCHIFVRDGVIEYLGDCTHKLAGQKVAMAPIPGMHAS